MSETNTKSGYAALVGKPNSGKSTLLNAILGTKLSIVTPKPQTTRKTVLGIYSTDNLQAIFFDTPGLLKPRYELQRSMMKFVQDSLDDADIVTILLDLGKYMKNSNYFDNEFLESLKKLKKPTILILNKIDLLKNVKEVLPIIDKYNKMDIFDEIIPASALKKSNVDEYLSVLEKYMPESPFFYDPEFLSTQPERFFVSEMIREIVFMSYGEEIPYSTEVHLTDFKEREKGKWYIAAEIIVEKDSQKKIVIGEDGQKLKKVGERSRREIEDYLAEPIYLDLFVKVRDKWRKKRNLLKSYGY